MKRVVAAALVLLALCLATSVSRCASRTWLKHSTEYPRLIRIKHGSPWAMGHILASTSGRIFESVDDGHSFKLIATILPQRGSRQRCCGTLFEVPQTVGSIRMGTLLYAASYLKGAVPDIEVYASRDEGRHWKYRSTPVMGGNSRHGLWEPEFTVTRGGALAMFWSDETDPCCSQKLAQMRTSDGMHWTDKSDTVRSSVEADRPGMAVVTKLPYGIYFMTYEICGPHYRCAIFSRTSADGWDYGPYSDLGKRIHTSRGEFFEHAATNVWSPSPLAPHGVIILVGQVLYNADRAVSNLDGDVLFVNKSPGGTGPWLMVSSPVKVPHSYDNYCPNYSSSLLPVNNGAAVLEFASDYRGNSGCVTYFATESWKAMIKAGKQIR